MLTNLFLLLLFYVKLSKLRLGEQITEMRSKEKNILHATKVLHESTIKKQKKIASTEGLILNKPLIPADLIQTMLAVLHILQRITMSLWVALMQAVQSLDETRFASKNI